MHKRDNLGKTSRDLIIKDDPNHTPIDQMREMLTDYEDNVWKAVDEGKKVTTKDFYVVVITKKEKLMPNVLRNYFFWVHACPTPTYDQTVYCYKADQDTIEFMWVVPSKDTCEFVQNNALTLPDDQKQLVKFVLDFYDDTLLSWAKKLNKEDELPSAQIIIEKE